MQTMVIKAEGLVLFPYGTNNNEKPIKIDFSGNVTLDNGAKGTILGVKGQSKDGNTKFPKTVCSGWSSIQR